MERDRPAPSAPDRNREDHPMADALKRPEETAEGVEARSGATVLVIEGRSLAALILAALHDADQLVPTAVPDRMTERITRWPTS